MKLLEVGEKYIEFIFEEDPEIRKTPDYIRLLAYRLLALDYFFKNVPTHCDQLVIVKTPLSIKCIGYCFSMFSD